MAAIVPWSVAGKAMGTVGKPLPEIQMKRKSTLKAARKVEFWRHCKGLFANAAQSSTKTAGT
jgi:hypothetical protein